MREARKGLLAAAIAICAIFAAVADGMAQPQSRKSHEQEVPPELVSNVEKTLDPISIESLKSARENLIRYIWKGMDPYKTKPSAVVDGVVTGNLALVVAADLKTIYVRYGERLSGFVEYARNIGPSPCLAIWAQGHEGIPPNPLMTQGGASYLTKQWARGCDVLVVPMPFRNETRIVIDTPKEGHVVVQQGMHDGMSLIDSPEFSAYRLFFDPLFAGLNWLEESGRRYRSITMAGVSGGGWMSVVYPAIDTRITEAVSVAGSLPMFLKYLPTEGRFRDIGDWEQHFAPFYRIASYYELYLLSALGDGRRQTLIYNYVDPCCYSGKRAMAFLPQLKRKAEQLRIHLQSMVDSSHDKHDISESAISAVMGGGAALAE